MWCQESRPRILTNGSGHYITKSYSSISSLPILSNSGGFILLTNSPVRCYGDVLRPGWRSNQLKDRFLSAEFPCRCIAMIPSKMKDKQINSPLMYTPWLINMEPTNQPFRKEHDLPNLHEDMFQPFIFQGATSSTNILQTPLNWPEIICDFFFRRSGDPTGILSFLKNITNANRMRVNVLDYTKIYLIQ